MLSEQESDRRFFSFLLRVDAFWHHFSIKCLPLYFVVNANLFLLYRVNKYSTQLMCIPNEIFIAKKFSFNVRLLYEVL